ncbi:MAG: hypothetical protein ACYCVH_13590 [Ignavibacteriaceae bacterium]
MKQNLQEYTTVHEKTFIYKNGKLEYFYVCEDPEINEFATISGYYNLEKKEDDYGIIIGFTGSNFFQTKQDALDESQDWMDKYIALKYDPLSSIINLSMQLEKYKPEVQ